MHTQPAPGYMFWDPLHPTTHVHYLLANQAYLQLTKNYNFKPYHENLEEKFRYAYAKKFNEDKAGVFGFFRNSRIDFAHASLEDILRHALKGKGNRTLEIIKELGWVDQHGFLKSHDPKLKDAMGKVMGAGFAEQQSSAHFENVFRR